MKKIWTLILTTLGLVAYGQEIAYNISIEGPTSSTYGQTERYTAVWQNADDGYEVVDPPPGIESYNWWSVGSSVTYQDLSGADIQWQAPAWQMVEFECYTWDNYYYGASSVYVYGGPDPPNALAPTSITATSFVANWSSVASATSYRLDVSTNSSFSSYVSGYQDLPVGTTNKAVTGLSAGTTYYYRVRTVDGNSGAVSGNSNTRSALTVPPPPTANSATSISASAFSANWSSSVTATGYRLDVSTVSTFASFVTGYNNLTVSGTTYSVTGLSVGTTYYYRVRAVNGSGTSANSNTMTLVTVPGAPVANAAFSITGTSFMANWNNSPSATGYRIDVSSSSAFSTYMSGYSNLSVSGTSQNVSGLSPGTTYYYRVRAVNGSGTSSNSNTINVLTLPVAPTANSPTSITASSFVANWNSVPSATSYRLDVSTVSTFSSFVFGYGNITVIGTNQSITGLSSGTTYYYRVRAENASGSSANSNTASALTLPAASVANNPTGITTSAFTANWSGVTSSTSYRLDVSTVNTFSSFLAGYNNLAVAGTSQNVTGLSAGTTYYYRVRAVNGSGTSANSNTTSALTIPAAPTANNATSIAATSFTANWGSVTSATSYRLDVSIASSFSSFVTGYNNLTVVGTSQSVTGLSPGTTYYYRVRAVNGSGASVNSNTKSLLTSPAAPAANSASSITATSFVANWGSVTSATSYRLDVSLTNTFSSLLTGYNDLSVTGTSQSVTGLSAGTTYYFRARAINGSGISANSSTTTVLTIPVAPTTNSASGITTTAFTANWDAVASATAYRLDVSVSNTFASFVTGYNNLGVSGTSHSVTGLWPGTTYYFRVRAVNGGGTSANSNTTIAVTIPAAPTTNAAGSITATSFLANWNGVASATSYRLDVSLNSSFATFVGVYNNLSVSVTSLNISGLSPNTTYFFRVRATNVNGVSSNSGTVSVLLRTTAPIASAATGISANSFIANWNSVTGAASYRLDVSTTSDFVSNIAGYTDLAVTGTSHAVTGLDSKTSYYYRVRAVNPTGPSANSNTISATYAKDQNYIRTTDVLTTGITTMVQVEGAAASDQLTRYSFFDGLGRPMQNVTRQGSPSGHDIVQPIVYDDFGREYRKYLPFVADETTGWYKDDVINSSTGVYQNAALNFYNNSNDAIADDGTPWAETKFEPSPLNRVLKQGAPGATWQPDNIPYATTTDHSVKYDYEANETDEVLLWTYIPPTPTYPLGFVNRGATNSYGENELFKTLTKDEDQHEMIEFRDKQDRVVLKKVQGPDNTWAQTYYIYDDFGSLVCVLQPEGVNHINEYFNADDAGKESFLGRWAFRYVYDGRRQMTMKQVPGADPVYMVYDDRDRLVLTQDGNQRNVSPTKEWTFTRYDALNRPVLTGKYASNSDLPTMQAAVNSFYDNLTTGQAWYDTYIGSTAGNVLGYDNHSFPQVSAESSYYTATYYDLYDSYIAPAGYAYLNESLPGQEPDSLPTVKGQVTGSRVKNLSSGAWLRTVNYYDDKYRVIQTVSDHQKGTIRTSNVYDFVGKILIFKRTYVVNSVTTTIKETYNYDHAGRVLNIKHAMNGGPDVMIVKNEYNEIGQLIDKKLHSTDGGTTFAQSIDHRYNIRGWLTTINEPDVSSVASGDPGYDYFGMELDYDNSVSGLSTSPVYNGNISAIQWSKGNGESVGKQAYAYTYDPMNRLEEASHFDYEGVLWAGNNRSFQEKINEYDLNGNIKKLSRREFGGMLMDSLFYGYTGNQLNYVHDYGNQTEGFVNTNTGTDDYDYDFNGNLDKDRNKGLLAKGDIKYNYLNLPQEVIKGTESIKYIYDATGKKLAQEVYSNNGGTLAKTTDYIGELVYEDNNLQFAQTSEGRVLPDGGGWEHQYHLKDHLGNVRVTFTTKPQTTVNYTANLETGTGGSGEGVFGNYTSSVYDLVDHTDAGAAYQNVQWLNGGASGRIGLTKSLSVMPGDRVSITAYAKYMNLGGTGNTNAFAAALTAAFGVSSGSTGEQLKLYNGLNDYGLAVAGGDHPDDDDTAPKAFVTILLFDRNYNLLDAAWDQITTDLEQVSATQKEPFAYPLSKEVVVHEPGFAYIFVSNEHPTYVDVYFDDVMVTHTPSPIVSSSDYFPFGLTFNAFKRENSLANQYLYNGKEKQDELDLGWLDYGARMYLPETGRWARPDPKSEICYNLTQYRYAFNNPVNVIDPDGAIEVPLRGTYVIQKNSSEYLENYSVYVRRTKSWIEQTGDFETAGLTPSYQANLASPDDNAIIRTSAWNILRKSTVEQPMTSPHIGTDFRAAEGTDVYSLGDGEIVNIDRQNGVMTVRYENGDLVTFRHLSSIGNFREGQSIYEGQVIAQSGKTNTTRAHLHVEAVDSEGHQVNFEERGYGAVSNSTFFNQFNGDFEYLKLWKLSQGQGETYEQENYSREEWEQLIHEILD